MPIENRQNQSSIHPLLNTLNGAALSASRRVKLLSTSGAAPCHVQDPASFPANAYLTAALFSVSPLDD